MTTPLKDKNTARLYLLVIGNLILFVTLQRSVALITGDWAALAQNIASYGPAAIGLVLVGIANAQADANTKAQLVYARMRDPLPGSEAFTRWGPLDPRVDMNALATKVGTLPTAQAEQNQLWYRLFKAVDDDPAVEHAHREWLYTRDFAFLSALMLPAFGGAAIAAFGDALKAFIYILALIAQFLLTVRAARHHGRRLVCTVLALAGVRDDVQGQNA